MRKLCGSIGAVTLVFLSLCGGANADIITFNGLAGPNQAPFVTYSEAGFTVAATGGSPEQGLLFGNPVPSLVQRPGLPRRQFGVQLHWNCAVDLRLRD